MKYLIIPALAGTLFLSGCADLMRNSGTTVAPVENKASIVVRTQIVAGGYQTAAGRLTSADIDHLVLQIFELNGATEKAVLDAQGNPVREDLTRNKLSSLITFSQLKAETKYRIRASAYKAPGTAPADLISTTDANSYVDVQVDTDERPTVTTLKVKLIDVDFNGQGTFQGVVVTPGGFRSTGPVSISIDDADPGDFLNEGNPASQGLLNLYTPVFKDGMTWRYKLVQTDGDAEYTGSFVQVISNVVTENTPDGPVVTGFTVTETVTWEDNEPDVEVSQLTPETWFPPASDLRDLLNENIVVEGKAYNGAAKLASAQNTATQKTYMWLAWGTGVVKIERLIPTQNGPITIIQSLEEFTSP